MSEQLFELTFKGILNGKVSPQQARDNVAVLFKANDTQLQRLFSGQTVTIKNKLPLATGQKYLEALDRAGVIAKLLDMETGLPWQANPAFAETDKPANPAFSDNAKPKINPAFAQASDEADKTSHEVEPDPRTKVGTAYHKGIKAPGWDVASAGADMQDEYDPHEAPDIDLSHLSVAPQEGPLVEHDDTPAPPAPDTSHITLEPDK